MKIRIKTFYVLCFAFLCLPLSVIGQDSFVKSAAVDSAVAEQMKQQRLVGVAIGIIQNSTVVYTKGYGFSNFESRTPVNESSVFNWASNSKPVMAVAAMQLVETGQLDLDLAIEKYLPDLPDHLSAVTTRQLLCHQSGIPHYSNGRIVPSEKRITARQELDPSISIHRFALSPLIFRPGSKTDYSSYAYVLLSSVVQSAGKKKIETQLVERIGRPLDLKSFQLDLPFTGQKNWVIGYKIANGAPEPIEDYAHFWKHGAGGYKSDVRDFAKFASALANKQLINEKTTTAMWTNQKTVDGVKSNYGLGVVVEGEGRSLKISHNGSQDETRTRMVLYPNQGHGVVVMCNTQGAVPGRITTAVYSAMNSR
ncbi:MAG: serine hydrolase domain-containing protein [Planctomycetota bacterium]|nr:serine hydrolase domain-containing protein [Planctomycetota bacterium]